MAEDVESKLWTQTIQWDNQDPAAWGIKALVADTAACGLSRDPNKIHTGMNSGYAAIGLAYHLGAELILLLGYDMQMDGEKRHWFGAHPQGLEVASNYQNFIGRFQSIRPADYGLEIWNVTRRTALQHFPVMNLDEVVEALRDTA